LNKEIKNLSNKRKRERGHWGDPDVDGRIMLRMMFRKLEGLWGLDGDGSG
jgi:hypothetical protein